MKPLIGMVIAAVLLYTKVFLAPRILTVALIDRIYFVFQETLNLMKAEGWKFPAVREAEAMFEADTAPEWAEGDVCNR